MQDISKSTAAGASQKTPVCRVFILCEACKARLTLTLFTTFPQKKNKKHNYEIKNEHVLAINEVRRSLARINSIGACNEFIIGLTYLFI